MKKKKAIAEVMYSEGRPTWWIAQALEVSEYLVCQWLRLE